MTSSTRRCALPELDEKPEWFVRPAALDAPDVTRLLTALGGDTADHRRTGVELTCGLGGAKAHRFY